MLEADREPQSPATVNDEVEPGADADPGIEPDLEPDLESEPDLEPTPHDEHEPGPGDREPRPTEQQADGVVSSPMPVKVAGQRRFARRRLLWLAGAALLVAGGTIVVVTRGGTQVSTATSSPPTPVSSATGPSVPDTPAPTTVAPTIAPTIASTAAPTTPASADPSPATTPPSALGSIADLANGARARLDAVTLDARAANDLETPPAGTGLVRLDVELCAGTEGLAVSPLLWSVSADDGTTSQPSVLGDTLRTINLPTGSCIRGGVDLALATGRRPTTATLTDASLAPVARWKVTTPTPATANPLGPSGPSPIGAEPETRLRMANGATGAFHAATANAPSTNNIDVAPAGSSITRLDVEVCAGATPTAVNPLYWMAVLDDSTILPAFLPGQAYPTVELSPDQCQRGTVDVVVPDGHRATTVVLVDGSFVEVARWHV